MKRVINGKTSVFLIFIMLLFYGCSEKPPVKVGFIGSLSGKRSDIGFFARNSVMLCVEEFNKNDGIKGRKIELVIENNKGEALVCEKKLNDLINRKTKFIIGPLLSQMAEAAMRSSKNKDVFIISPSMSSPVLSAKDDNILRTAFTASVQSVLLANYMHKKGESKIGVIYDLSNKGYTEPLYKEFVNQLNKKNKKVSFVKTINGDSTKGFKTIVQEIVKTDLDAVLLCLSATDAATFSQHLREKTKKTRLYGVMWAQTNDLIKYGGRAVEGMHLVSIFKNKNKTERHLEFERKYKAKFGEKPSFVSILAWDAATILFKAMANSKSLTPQSVKKTILKTRKYSGLNSEIIFDKFGDVHGNYALTKVMNSRYVPVTD